MKALLILSDGTFFEGTNIGVAGTTTGEVVFNTSMTGYQEILTDPSYAGQIVALTYPLIGNYGINDDDNESINPQVAGFIVKEMCENPSNYRSDAAGDDYLKQYNIVGIQGIDVRALVKNLRDHGVMLGMVTTEHTVEEGLAILHNLPDYDSGAYARQVTTPRPYQWQQGEALKVQENKADNAPLHHTATAPPDQWEMPLEAGGRVVVLDYGTKFNILRSLRDRGLEVIVLPCTATPEEILQWQPDGILLSNGPGDPKALDEEVKNIQSLQQQNPNLPMFGICLGHQILGRAMGGETFKLKFGHRGANHPVKDLTTGKVHITTQNHGYAVQADSLPDDVEVTHLNLNDNTVEGLRHREKPVFSVQYHPEASPGPKDNAYLFDRFADLVKKKTEYP
ncbi:MAG: glutamine-hydrolyzing carbamoyl-phosphate synthase small subunit [Abitibacteriaceae bacterium]|nr:glutamine-hydrolyzing carbamoyl-phosphate synthase small subunit [Abditibacteriaceae bacterium]